jgi:autotransporter-associated beta strand protein
VNKITGSGTIATGLAGAGYQNLTIGVDNGSSSFGGVVTDSLAPGNLVKTGTGTITLSGASTYTGRTTVEAGTLSLAQAFLNNNGTVVIGSSGILDLGFTGTDVVGSIEIAGSGPLPPGVYDTNHPDYGDYITGTGSLEILGGNGTWASLAPGDWSVASNWSGNKVASGINSIATFNAATAVTVNLDSTRTIGGLAFGTTG